MFGFRHPRPPLTTRQRLDIELLLRRTCEVIGIDAVRQAVVITDLSQLDLDLSEPLALLQSADVAVRNQMLMSDVHLQLEIVDGDKLGYPSTYRAAAEEGCLTIISVADQTTVDPLRTVMELAYQYSHHYWQADPNPQPLDDDPRTTHLLPLCYGMGVLASDASLCDTHWTQAGWSGWSISRTGYYNAEEIGYALALLWRYLGRSNPQWLNSLRLDSRATYQQAWRYFADLRQRKGTLLFDSNKIPSSDRDPAELAGWLAGDDMTFALAAAYALSKLDELPPLVVQAALVATERADRDLVPVAVRLLAGSRHDSPEVIQRVCELIDSHSSPIALAAIQSAHALGINLVPFATRVGKLLDSTIDESIELTRVIAQQGDRLASLEKSIIRRLSLAIRHIDDELAVELLHCLTQVVADPENVIRKRIKSPALRSDALERLEAWQGVNDIPNGGHGS